MLLRSTMTARPIRGSPQRYLRYCTRKCFLRQEEFVWYERELGEEFFFGTTTSMCRGRSSYLDAVHEERDSVLFWWVSCFHSVDTLRHAQWLSHPPHELDALQKPGQTIVHRSTTATAAVHKCSSVVSLRHHVGNRLGITCGWL